MLAGRRDAVLVWGDDNVVRERDARARGLRIVGEGGDGDEEGG